MPTARKQPYHHGDLRRALLDATLALAGERGAAGVTLREVARVAGVSQTAPYRHFPDKLAMLAAASEEGFALLNAALRAALKASKSDPHAELLTLGASYVRFALDHAAHFRLMFGHGSPPKAAAAGLQQAAQEVFQLFFGTVARCLGKKPSGRVVRQVVFRIWALAAWHRRARARETNALRHR